MPDRRLTSSLEANEITLQRQAKVVRCKARSAGDRLPSHDKRCKPDFKTICAGDGGMRHGVSACVYPCVETKRTYILHV